MFLISAARASSPGASLGAGSLAQFLPLILIVLVFYFLLIRPQQKRTKAHKDMLAALRRGDRIITNGGLIASVSKVEDTEVAAEIAEGVKVRIQRDMIAAVKAKTEPVDR